jgi:hypothetical protein
VFVFVVFGGRTQISLWGASGLAMDFVPQTLAIAVISTTVATLLTRRRVRSGAIAPLQALSIRFPQQVAVRAILFALCALPIFGGVGTLLCAMWWRPEFSFATLLTIKIIYGAILAGCVALLALRAALGDSQPPANNSKKASIE